MKKLLLLTIAALPIFAAAQTVPAYVPTNGLVGWWPFNGNANDESGNGNNGTVSGATLTTDRNGNTNSAYSFDGASNYISVNDDSSLDVSNVSVSAWYSAADYGLASQLHQGHIISKREVTGWGTSFQLAVESTTATNGIWATYTIGSNGWVAFNSNSVLTTNNWINVVYTHDDSLAKLYINGNLVSTTNVLGGLSSNTLPLWFGARPLAGGNSSYFHGKLDDIGIWNRALTQQEVTNLYNTSLPQTNCLPNYVPTNGLIGFWPFCGNANDESGNGNHGTVNGATLTTDRNGNTNSAYSFNCSNWSVGSGDEIYIPYAPAFNSTNITVSAWAYSSSLFCSSQPHIILNRFQYGYSTPNGETFQMGVTSTNQIFTEVLGYNSNNTWSNITDIAATINNNAWVNVVMTFDGFYLKQFVNGVIIDSLPANGFTLNTAGNSGISIGISNQANGYWQPMDGKVDDIGIWNRALTQHEISDLYNGQLTTGFSVNNNESEILIFPNPSKDYFSVSINRKGIKTLTLLDGSGRMIRTYNVSSTQTQLSLEGLESGVYFLSANGENKMVKRIVKE